MTSSSEKLRLLFAGVQEIDTKRKPNHSNWSTRKCYRAQFLRGFQPPSPAILKLSKYGGFKARKVAPGSGFFQIMEKANQFFFVDPDGYAFYSFGMNSVRRDFIEARKKTFMAKFGSDRGWAEECTKLLRSIGVNFLGPWSDDTLLASASSPIPYTKMLNVAAAFGKTLGYTKPGSGHVDFKEHCIPVFHPDFEAFAMRHVREVIGDAGSDSYCVGFFSDNELPWRRDILKCYLKLDQKDPGFLEAVRWMRENNVEMDMCKDTEVNMRFLGHVAEKYFRVCREAIKQAAPNHLYLGARFHGQAKKHLELFKVAGNYVDVVSVNWYDTWDPRSKPEWTDMWTTASGKPFMITEFYAKGMDSKLPNKAGAGWVVKTQKERGLFFEHFVLGLMEHRGCVGFQWFKFMDDYPKNEQLAKTRSNKGILNADYETYNELTEAMGNINNQGYALVEFLRK
eukprot:CAMPEP_0184503500 /NCGR_PEP_ID=MMETSP0113_2-20130426/51894_1 /TAXON_ID=91329 /ORGANISM="Norrisiella sphaerica, Strain BC52" /LENGTH=452 /DNA_ID=CAMNT_0026893003 /DNA_START=298 /DNA_END=1656 /DNA_ORIENTATION=+